MKTTAITKFLSTLIVASWATLASFGQNAVDVRSNPSEDALIIGQIESATLAVNAEWPTEQPQVSGWRPIFYRGTFDIYVSNSDIAKDLSPKPGSKYLLSPGRNTQTLSIATKEDKAEIISVDARYSRMSVETILLGYIQDFTPPPAPPVLDIPETTTEQPAFEDAPSVQPVTPLTTPSATVTESDTLPPAVQPIIEPANPVRRLLGHLQNASASEKRRYACSYELVDSNGKLLAYISTENLPKLLVLKEYVGSQVVTTGHLFEVEGSTALRFVANSVKRAN